MQHQVTVMKRVILSIGGPRTSTAPPACIWRQTRHHLAAEILDNAMDEAVAGHANRIDFVLESATTLTIRDNGRGMPTGKHQNSQKNRCRSDYDDAACWRQIFR